MLRWEIRRLRIFGYVEFLLFSVSFIIVNICGFVVVEVDFFFTFGFWDSNIVLGEDEDVGFLGVRFLVLRVLNIV